MLWAKFDVDIFEDPGFQAIYDLDPLNFGRFMRLVQVAKKANRHGLVATQDGRSFDARSLGRLHDAATPRVTEWQAFLQACSDLGLVAWDKKEEAWRISDWSRWHGSPSDEPKCTRERKIKSRINAENQIVTNGHECHDTEQSRAEKSRVEQEQGKSRVEQEQSKSREEQNIEEKSKPAQRRAREESTPVVPPGASSLSSQDIFFGEVLHRTLLPQVPFGSHPKKRLEEYVATCQGQQTGLNSATPADLQVALQYGCDAATHATTKADRKKPVADLWAYALGIAKAELGRVIDYRDNQDRAAAQGFAHAGPLQFRPEAT